MRYRGKNLSSKKRYYPLYSSYYYGNSNMLLLLQLAFLAEVGTDYFDLLSYYHYPFSMFDSKKAQLKKSWIHMTELPKATVKKIGVSNFYASHLTKLFDVCQELNLQKPFANEIQIINP